MLSRTQEPQSWAGILWIAIRDFDGDGGYIWRYARLFSGLINLSHWPRLRVSRMTTQRWPVVAAQHWRHWPPLTSLDVFVCRFATTRLRNLQSYSKFPRQFIDSVTLLGAIQHFFHINFPSTNIQNSYSASRTTSDSRILRRHLSYKQTQKTTNTPTYKGMKSTKIPLLEGW